MMKTSPRMTTAERAGRIFGYAWGRFMHQEVRAVRWLAGKGVPTAPAKALLWTVKLAVLGTLLYAAFWLALLLVFAITVAWASRNTDWKEPEPEWRMGLSGYGLYRGDERIDPGSPDDN
jgi:hypothetical protein